MAQTHLLLALNFTALIADGSLRFSAWKELHLEDVDLCTHLDTHL